MVVFKSIQILFVAFRKIYVSFQIFIVSLPFETNVFVSIHHGIVMFQNRNVLFQLLIVSFQSHTPKVEKRSVPQVYRRPRDRPQYYPLIARVISLRELVMLRR